MRQVSTCWARTTRLRARPSPPWSCTRWVRSSADQCGVLAMLSGGFTFVTSSNTTLSSAKWASLRPAACLHGKRLGERANAATVRGLATKARAVQRWGAEAACILATSTVTALHSNGCLSQAPCPACQRRKNYPRDRMCETGCGAGQAAELEYAGRQSD